MNPHLLVAFNAPSLVKFGPTVRPGGIVLYDSSVIGAALDNLGEGVRVVGVPFAETARDLGSVQVKNDPTPTTLKDYALWRRLTRATVPPEIDWGVRAGIIAGRPQCAGVDD